METTDFMLKTIELLENLIDRDYIFLPLSRTSKGYFLILLVIGHAIIKSVFELYEDEEITIAGLFPACSCPV